MRYRQVIPHLGLILATLAFATTPAHADQPLELPHRQHRLTVDADLDDWRGPALEILLAEPEVPTPLANSGTFRLVWDHDHLWFAAEIRDSEVYPPPTTATGSALYQWDSIELYIDGRGDRAERMDADDFQLIISCDGRYAALQGDPLLRAVEEWEVPKRLQSGLIMETAVRHEPWGYVIEGAVPFSAIGVSNAEVGRTLAIDVAWNDWIEDHPRLPELLKDLENLAQLIGHETEHDAALVDPDSLGWDGLLAWEERAYRAWSWRSERDFGRPTRWATVTLVGAPPMLDRLVNRWGAGTLLAVAIAVLVAAALMIDLELRRRHRRRVHELLGRITQLEAPAPTEDRPELMDRLATGAPSDTITRMLAVIRDRLDQPLPVGELATRCGVSLRTLQRTCQDELGASPRDVILTVKMQRAHELLTSGRWRVGEVAEQVGFDSPYHFSRRFKDLFGKPPSAVIPARAANES